MKKTIVLWAAAILLIPLALTGCAGSSKVAQDEGPTDIRWLTNRLHDEGVFVVERGSPSTAIPADKSSRLVLNQREVLDVYDFTEPDRARTLAEEFAGLNPQDDVYLKDSLIIVRYSTRDTGLNQVLYGLLGAAI